MDNLFLEVPGQLDEIAEFTTPPRRESNVVLMSLASQKYYSVLG